MNTVRNFCIIILVWFCFFTLSSDAAAQSTVKIEGHVTDQDGLPLEGASILIDGSAYGAATNSAGYYRIENLFIGTYTIRAQYAGYQDQYFENIQIRNEGTTIVNFKLTEKIYLSEILFLLYFLYFCFSIRINRL